VEAARLNPESGSKRQMQFQESPAGEQGKSFEEVNLAPCYGG
jgi:hypothetical protein